MIRGIVFPLLKTIMRVRTNGSVILEMCNMERCQERTFLSNCGSVSIHDTLFLIIICWHARKHSFSHNPFAFSASEDRFSEFNCTYCYIASIEVNQRLLPSCQETDRNMIFANAKNLLLAYRINSSPRTRMENPVEYRNLIPYQRTRYEHFPR